MMLGSFVTDVLATLGVFYMVTVVFKFARGKGVWHALF